MSFTVRKGLIGTQDIKFYSSASPTFSRYSSSGGVTTATALGATHIPILNATGYFQTSNVERALNDLVTRYHSKEHSIATYGQGAGVGDHLEMMGFRNGFAATSIQAAASNMYLSEGAARIILPEGTITLATPIQLPRKTFIFGNGANTILRASSTVLTSRIFSISGQVGATNSALSANATANTSVVGVADGTKFDVDDWIILRAGSTGAAASMELHQIKSISGNDLTVHGRMINLFRSIATVAHASLVYPAELTMDNMTLKAYSTVQGIGVAATYLVNSKIGDQTFIYGAATNAALIKRSSYNNFEFNAYNQANTSGYGVYLTENSHSNRVTGRRIGVLKDVATLNSKRNFVFGTTWNGTYSASNLEGIIQATSSLLVKGNVTFATSGTINMANVGNVFMSAAGANDIRNAATRSNASVVGIGGVAISNSSATCNVTNTGVNGVDIGHLRVRIATIGRPVFVFLTPASSASDYSLFYTRRTGNVYCQAAVKFKRNGNIVALWNMEALNATFSQSAGQPVSGFAFLDLPPASAAGTYYVYQVNIAAWNADTTTTLRYAKLCAVEL